MCQRLEVIGVDAVANTEEKGERERELVYVCMRVSGVGGGRYGPRAATAASEASPFFLQAFLPPPRFSPLHNSPLSVPLMLYLSLLFSLNFSPFFSLSFPCSPRTHFPSLFLPVSVSLSLDPLYFLPLSILRSLSPCHTLSQSIQPDPPSLPSVRHPRNAFQSLPTPPGATYLPLSPGPLSPSIPFLSLLYGATLTPPATAQTPPNRATPGLIKEQRGSASAREGRCH